LLDNDTVTEDLQDTIAAEDGQDTVESEAEEVVISIEGEEPEADPDAVPDEELGEAGKRALKAAREAAKESARKAREAEERAAAIEAQYKPKEPEIKRPTLEDCGFNEDVFAERMAAFVIAEDKRKAAAAEEQNRQKASTEAYQAKLAKYHEDRTKVGVDDDAQARVVAKLSPQQQAALMDASMDPAKVVAALAKTPKVLDELAGIKEIHRFAYKLAQVEGKITMTTKAPPPPESKLRGGLAAADTVARVPLEKLREKAQDSGDWSSYFSEKRRREAAGVKS
jgi:hypothetical protein